MPRSHKGCDYLLFGSRNLYGCVLRLRFTVVRRIAEKKNHPLSSLSGWFQVIALLRIRVKGAELILDALHSPELLFGDDGFVNLTQDIGAAVDLAHGIVIGLIIDEVDLIALRPETSFDDSIKSGNVAGRNQQVAAQNTHVHHAGQKCMAA